MVISLMASANFLLLFFSIFVFDVMSDESCDRLIEVHSGKSGSITSPNYPRPYPAGSDCIYKLVGSSSSVHISLSFPFFEVEQHANCQFDYVAIYDGPSKLPQQLITRLCGSNPHYGQITSTGKFLTLHFHADTSVQADGFQIEYTAGCNYVFTETSGHVSSPGFPSSYPPNSDCTYSIEPASGSQILLKFTQFELETSSHCNFDYVRILIADTALGTYCGEKNGDRRLYNTSRLTLNFHSDRSLSRPGFFINYKVTTSCNDDNGGCFQTCRDVSNGKVVCSCAQGYELSDDGVSCQDLNECLASPCDDVCTNIEGSYTCSCSSPGYQLSPNNRTCTDMTCKINNGGCEHICQPFGPSQYHCACYPGYVISDDAHNCTDINECNSTDPKYQHSCAQRCINEPGSYYCDCDDGYQVSSNRRSCDDIDECPTNEHVCGHLCRNIPGGWECACFRGYEVDPDDPHDCVDIDECERGIFPTTCLTCLNFEGSYECSCLDGYVPNDDNTNCTDVNECLVNNGGCPQICINSPGSFSCVCESGYRNISNTCKDINECASNNNRGPCDHYCENLDGSFQCHCSAGHSLQNDKLSCKDNNECDNGKNGGCQQKCVNSPGSYLCECDVGYSMTDDNCLDIDECAGDPCDSTVETKCSNLVGSFTCECPSGYVVTNITQCVDTDECAGNKHNCQQHCVNNPGSFECTCFEGYVSHGTDDECIDINECSQDGICEQQCHNMVGSYRCDCDAGFLLGNERNCSDIDECAEGLDDCEQICINEVGYHRCNCSTGYRLNFDNTTCSDINECEGGLSGCSDQCVNLQGSYLCFCPPGFQLMADNHTCHDINECEQNNGGCAHICNNFNGSFTCGCHDGFQFNGTFGCMDIDECQISNGNCSQTCNNLEGSYECQCDPNFKLDDNLHGCSHCPNCTQFEQVQNDVTMLKPLINLVNQLTENNARLSATVSDLVERIAALERGASHP